MWIIISLITTTLLNVTYNVIKQIETLGTNFLLILVLEGITAFLKSKQRRWKLDRLQNTILSNVCVSHACTRYTCMYRICEKSEPSNILIPLLFRTSRYWRKQTRHNKNWPMIRLNNSLIEIQDITHLALLHNMNGWGNTWPTCSKTQIPMNTSVL